MSLTHLRFWTICPSTQWQYSVTFSNIKRTNGDNCAALAEVALVLCRVWEICCCHQYKMSTGCLKKWKLQLSVSKKYPRNIRGQSLFTSRSLPACYYATICFVLYNYVPALHHHFAKAVFVSFAWLWACSQVGVAVAALKWFTTSSMCMSSVAMALSCGHGWYALRTALCFEICQFKGRTLFFFLFLLCNAVFSEQRCGFWTSTTVTSRSITPPCSTCPSPSSPRRCLPSRSTTWGKVKWSCVQYFIFNLFPFSPLCIRTIFIMCILKKNTLWIAPAAN